MMFLRRIPVGALRRWHPPLGCRCFAEAVERRRRVGIRQLDLPRAVGRDGGAVDDEAMWTH